MKKTKKELTKEKIHKTLLLLLEKEKIDKIKITQLCRLAAINRGTFYLHYDCIEDVFEELYEVVINDLKETYNYSTYSEQTFYIQNINAQKIKIFFHIEKFKTFYKIILSQKENNSYYFMLFDQIRINLQNSFIYPTETKDDVEYFIGYHVNAIIGLILIWYQRDFKETPEEMNYILHSIYLKALK